MKLIWSPEALHDLAAVHAYISQHDPVAAAAVVNRIVSLVEDKLPTLPRLGRRRRVKGTRELAVSRTPLVAGRRAPLNR